MKYVIIGNSTAAVGAIEGIRQADTDGEIALITNEPYHTYSRPLISYMLLGKVTDETIKYRPDDFYEKNRCTLLYASALKIDAKAKQVTIGPCEQPGRPDNPGSKDAAYHRAVTTQETVPYDKLLVAAGSSAFVPPFEGLDTVKNKHTFMSLDDAHGLSKTLTPESRVLIIGAGLIGLKCAEGILGKVKHITVVDLAPGILSSILDEDGAAIVQKHLENGGIEFKLACSVKCFSGNTAVTDSGDEIGFDVLVLAVGVRPNTSLLEGIAEIGRGIVINDKSETSAADIYAAGDCTQTTDISSSQSRIMALLPNAYIQGECAGVNMAGGDKSFGKAIPMNAIGFHCCGGTGGSPAGETLHVITAGSYTGSVYVSNDGGNYKRLFYSDNKLNGYILIGNVDKAGIYTGLIREQTPLDTIDFGLVCEKPMLMAFTKEVREAKLGSEV